MGDDTSSCLAERRFKTRNVCDMIENVSGELVHALFVGGRLFDESESELTNFCRLPEYMIA